MKVLSFEMAVHDGRGKPHNKRNNPKGLHYKPGKEGETAPAQDPDLGCLMKDTLILLSETEERPGGNCCPCRISNKIETRSGYLLSHKLHSNNKHIDLPAETHEYC